MAALSSSTNVVRLPTAAEEALEPVHLPRSAPLPPNVLRFKEPDTYADAVYLQAKEMEAARLLGRQRAKEEAQRLAPPSPEMELIHALMETLDERTAKGKRKRGSIWYRTLDRLNTHRPKGGAAEQAFRKLYDCRRLDRESEAS